MTDLHARLAALRAPALEPDATTHDDVVAADLLRGRRAVARRRTVRAATTGALALAVGGAAGVVVASTDGHGAHEAPGVRLVDYAGQQLPGFTIDKVPAGFVLQGASAGVLDVARPGDHSSLDDFTNKIVVTVESTRGAASAGQRPSGNARPHILVGPGDRLVRHGDRVTVIHADGSRIRLRLHAGGDVRNGGDTTPADVVGAPIEVDGSAGTVTTNSEGTKTFRYTDGDRRVVIQAWPSLGLTDAQLEEFADGVSVTSAAQLSHG
jgi:hypothetical protein